MEPAKDIIKEPMLRYFAQNRTIRNACVSGQDGGYVIKIQFKDYVGTLVSSRGGPRLFTLDNAAKYLRSIGLPRFEVDASGFVPGRIRGPRPDRAVALRTTKTKSPKESLIK